MAPPESTKKRGRPRKESAAPPSQKKGPKKSKSNSSSQPVLASQNEIDSIIKSPDDTQETDKMDSDPNDSKKCWFTPDSDGKSDMDLVAKWCSVFENYNAWHTQKQVVVRERLAAFIEEMGHAPTSGQECEKKIKKLKALFEKADGL
ncbi:hypothetical protein DFH28DRAFT_1006179 [Melampsora americana]|nr:hypothetical protein DFH28DRAFT_1006179 [Melampsora americana]